MDPSHPERKQYEVNKMQMELEWPALLRNRLVISDSFASGVTLSPLHYLDAGPADEKSLLTQPAAHSLAYASDFLSNPERSQMPPDEAWNAVPSVQASNGLASEVDTQVASWKKVLEGLVEDKRVQSESIKNGAGQEAEAHSKVLLSQLERTGQELTHLESQVKADGNVLLSKIQTLSELLPHDITVIRQGVKLPNLEFNQMANEIGVQQTRSVIGIVDNFHGRLIPWLEKKEQALQSAYGRRQGTDFYFTGRFLPPRLWVKKLEMTSKEAASGTGDVIGRISDLSSEPSVQPAHMSLQASFSKVEVSNVQLEAQIDHRNNQVDDKLQLTVASFPIRDLDFVKTPSLRMGIEQATGNLSLEYLAEKDSAVINISSKLQKISYRIESSHDPLKKIFDEALSPLTTLDLDAGAQGRFGALTWTYNSNLSDRLRMVLQQTLSQEYAEFYTRIKDRADQKVLEEKKMLEQKLVSESDAVQQHIRAERDALSATLAAYAKKK